MPDWRLVDYTVYVPRGVRERRLIIGSAITFGEIEGFGTVYIFFFNEAELPSLIGQRTESDTSDASLVLHMPLSDFETVYHILQTEKPVWVNYAIEPEDDTLPQNLVRFVIQSRRERLGEGFADDDA